MTASQIAQQLRPQLLRFPGFRAFVDPSDLHGALQFTSGERFFCEQVKVRWPFATAGSPLFAEYQKILVDVSQGRRPEFAAVWNAACAFWVNSAAANRSFPRRNWRAAWACHAPRCSACW